MTLKNILLNFQNFFVSLCNAIGNYIFTIESSNNTKQDGNPIKQESFYKHLSRTQVTKGLVLLAHEKKLTKSFNLESNSCQQSQRPLVLILGWLNAIEKHVTKYADIYIEKGFDVLIVTCNSWQVLWPTRGTQVIASDIIKFLKNEEAYNIILIHGFSMGGYLWGECMVQMKPEIKRYEPMLNKIVGQIWDSLADTPEVHKGIPKAIFPKNDFLKNVLENYMKYHLKIFYKVATRHYAWSSKHFHNTLVNAPALLFYSENDPIGTKENSFSIRDDWCGLGIAVRCKEFKDSPHVGHFVKYPKEYRNQVLQFLNGIPLLQDRF